MAQNLSTEAHRLLEESPEAYYWAGMIAADGSLGRNCTHLKLTLNDHDHVEKFAKFIGWQGIIGKSRNGRNSTVAFSSADIIRAFALKFDLRQRKTYDPPTDIKGDEPCQFAFVVGFIDGDGHIRRQSGGRRGALIAVKCHRAWLPILDQLRTVIAPDSPPATINARGYAKFCVTNHAVIKSIGRRVLEMELPVMMRKWGNIDFDFDSRVEVGGARALYVTEQLSRGVRKGIIAKAIGVSPAAITLIIRTRGIITYKGSRYNG